MLRFYGRGILLAAGVGYGKLSGGKVCGAFVGTAPTSCAERCTWRVACGFCGVLGCVNALLFTIACDAAPPASALTASICILNVIYAWC